MADVATVIFEHNLDISSVETLCQDFSQRTGKPVFITNYDEDFNKNPPIPDGYDGWVVFLDPLHDSVADVNYFIFVDRTKGKELVIYNRYAEITCYNVDCFFEWHTIALILDLYNGISLQPDILQRCKDERATILRTLKKFGGKKCYMYNGERHEDVIERIMKGMDIETAFATNPIPLKMLNFHALTPNYQYRDSEDWYDTVLVDDFSDIASL